MRRLALLLSLFASASIFCAGADDSVPALKARLENATPEQRPDISIRIAEHQLHDADRLYKEGHVEEARAALDDIAAYTEKARDAAVLSKKRMKNIEIAARKMSEKLSDIKRTLAFEDQPPLDQAIHRLEDVRTSLLKEMFSDKKERKK